MGAGGDRREARAGHQHRGRARPRVPARSAQLGNTFDGHRLIHLAADHGLQEAANERLLSAYMTEGRAISDRATLADLAAEIGIDRGEALDALESGLHAEDVRNDERLAGDLGISAVPFFVFDRHYGASAPSPPTTS